MRLPASLRAYALGTALLAPAASLVLGLRARRGKEDRARLGERLGRSATARPAGPLVWLHGVSVGESLSLLPLVERFRQSRPQAGLLLTTGTRTAAALVAARAPEGVIHQFAPVDTPGAVRRFLDHWRPDVGLFCESELWPNLILSARRRGVALALVSARITERTARGWRFAPGAARTLLQAFDLILPQDDTSARRIEGLGGSVSGRLNLKLAAPPLRADEKALADLRRRIGDRPVVLGASTHAPEEAMLATAGAALSPRPLLILAPRHPERGAAVAAELAASGRRVSRRSAGETVDPDTDIYLADTLGELGLLFRLADVVVMGGSFFGGVGGHNPLEPARLARAVVFGPDVDNFAEVCRGLQEAGGASQVRAQQDLACSLASLLADPARRRNMAAAALAYAEAEAGALDRTWGLIAALGAGKRA